MHYLELPSDEIIIYYTFWHEDNSAACMKHDNDVTLLF